MKLLQKQVTTFFCLLLCCTSFAKMVELKEDFTAKQAPQNIVTITKEVASLMEFEKSYEVAIPKKAGIQINPWNKFVTRNINPQTKNPVIIVNTEWFLKLPKEQQTFLLGQYFLFFKQGIPFKIKYFPFLTYLLRFFLIILMTWGLGKTILPNKKIWVRFFIVWCFMFILNTTVLNKLQMKMTNHLNAKYAMRINETVVQKTGNREAAIQALEALQRGVTNEFENDETFWTPYKTIFQDYADALKQKK